MTPGIPLRRRTIVSHVLSLVLVLALPLIDARPALAKSLTEVVDESRARVRENFVAKSPGFSVAVGLDGKIIWSEGFGFADLEANKPVTTQTLFRIGSVSKPLTAAGLMVLVEKGKLDLDADIHRYVADFPDKGEAVTTRQLAGHLGGIRHYKGDEFLLNRPFASVRESLRIFENDPLHSRPGEKFLYSSYGWNLISAVMETAAKQEFLSYMKQAVFDPLGMTSTVPDYAGRDLPLRSRFYELKADGGFKIAPTVDSSYKWAGGGFLSTAEDMVRFGTAHLQPGFLKGESLDALFTPQKTSDGKPTTLVKFQNRSREWDIVIGIVGILLFALALNAVWLGVNAFVIN